MQTEIEPLVKKQIGKEVNRIAQEQVRDIMNNGKIKTKSDRFNFNDDDENEEEDYSEEVEMASSSIENSNSISDEEADKILLEIEAKESYDIFTDVGDYWLRKEQTVRYDINKGNKLLTKKDHPYSWEELQKEYGGGTYKVMARLPANGNRYLKAQSKSLHNAPETSPDYLLKNLMDKNKSLEERSNTNQGFNMQEILETVRRTNAESIEQANRMRAESTLLAEKARQEAKEEARSTLDLFEKMMEKSRPAAAPDLLTQLTPLLTAVLPRLLERPAPAPAVDSSKFQFDMMMKIQQMNVDMMKEAQETNKEMFRTLSDSIKELAKEKKTPVSENGGMSAFEMYKMMNDAKTDGFEQMRMVQEYSKELAMEREELRGDRSDTPAEKESTVDMLLKGLVPVIAGKFAGGSNPAPRIPQPVQRVAQSPQVIPSQRGAVSPTNNGIRSNENRPSGVKVQANQARTNEGSNKQGEAGLRNTERPHLNIPSLEAPRVAETSTSVKKDFLNSGDDVSFDTKTMPSSSASFTEPEAFSTPLEEAFGGELFNEEISSEVIFSPKDQGNAEAILTIVAPIAIEGYTTDGVSLDSIANKAIVELSNAGIDLTTVQRDFDEETLSGIITALPEDLQLLTKELRNVIISKIARSIE